MTMRRYVLFMRRNIGLATSTKIGSCRRWRTYPYAAAAAMIITIALNSRSDRPNTATNKMNDAVRIFASFLRMEIVTSFLSLCDKYIVMMVWLRSVESAAPAIPKTGIKIRLNRK